MSKFKSYMMPMMAVAALASAMPAVASAQGYGPAPRGNPDRYEAPYAPPSVFAQRKDQLERRIDRAVSQRRLDARKSREFKQELNEISRLERDYARGGLSRQERQRLEQRYDRVEQRLDREIRDDRRDPPRGGRR